MLLLVIVGFISCQQNQPLEQSIKEGMIKVAIFYPNEAGKTFDMDYYATKHMPMAKELMGDDLKAWSIDKGIAGGKTDSPATYSAIGYFYFADLATYKEAMSASSEKLRADVPNYTNIIPTLQVSEIQSLK